MADGAHAPEIRGWPAPCLGWVVGKGPEALEEGVIVPNDLTSNIPIPSGYRDQFRSPLPQVKGAFQDRAVPMPEVVTHVASVPMVRKRCAVTGCEMRISPPTRRRRAAIGGRVPSISECVPAMR